MKKAKFFRYAALALAAVCALTLAGCPTDPEPDPELNPDLVAVWTNATGEGNIHGGLFKEFTIRSNSSFTASINPKFIMAYFQAYNAAISEGAEPAQAEEAAVGTLNGLAQEQGGENATRWTVIGRLASDVENTYIMGGLTETFGKQGFATAGTATQELNGFNGHAVRILFADNKESFDFVSATNDANVNLFFGGHYTKVSP
jgi:hypothetical protein